MSDNKVYVDLKRKSNNPVCCIGDLFFEGKLICYSLEDTDRGLTNEMTLPEIQAIKIHGKTALPTGEYEIIKYYSPRFKMWVPLYLNVKGFSYAEMHSGNKAEDTDGCTLTGTAISGNSVTGSRIARDKMYKLIFEALDSGKRAFIRITKNY